MVKTHNKESCCGCCACADVCPKQCITMTKNEEGFLYPYIDKSACVNCGLCEKVCPFLKTEPKRKEKPLSYAIKINDDDLRNKSSSGGVFSIFAKYYLANGGVVYGAAFSSDFKSVNHIRVTSEKELNFLRGSKYLQSTIGDIFVKVKKDLDDSKYVLFTGVPCQVNALKLFLGKTYNKLFTLEVICHGVPSPLLWEKYTNYLEGKFGAKISNVNFRDKRNGWKSFGLTEESDKLIQYLDLAKDPYMIMFLRNYSLRESCFNCKAKTLESMADVTVGDFWGVRYIVPEMDDDKGVSLVLVHSEKANDVLRSLKNEYFLENVDYEKSIIFNSPYYESVKRPKERATFFEDMNGMDFDSLCGKYCKPLKTTAYMKLKSFIKHLLRQPRSGGGGSVQYKSLEYGLMIEYIKKLNVDGTR